MNNFLWWNIESISFHRSNELYISLENFIESTRLFDWRPPIGITWNGIFVARMSQIGYGHGGRKVFWGIWISWDTIHTSHLTLTFWVKVARALTFKRSMSNLNLKDFLSKFWTRLLPFWWKISFRNFLPCVIFIGQWTLNFFSPYDFQRPQECGWISNTNVLVFFLHSRYYIPNVLFWYMSHKNS